MTTNLDARLTSYSAPVLSIFRIVFGLLFTLHGAQKVLAWPTGMQAGPGDFTGPAVPVGTWPYWWAGLLEIVLGLLITVGLFTRIAAFIAAGQMAVAYFWQHLPKAFFPIENGGEPAILFCFGFLLLVAMGAGAWSIDALRQGRAVVRS
ncbi:MULTISPECIES: DoxX family protein [Mycolicibacterium]|jgi:putative oxidoreductase|uniref:DoxX family protein n=2 Tax=Mycolicibacterium TaxID=1866885 RepID=A1TB35_MYCVP|nr:MULTISPECIES: DoxX family protein [Mycolicibacterium]ABM14385.1 DoxX family protein [Mycolicibacterium vanbaalenii PYR-1]MCV7126463.1 DoxX family protein [Mycolicibacterium vanbaalenii PYR-1]MDN4519887.1 DoxX family protein [Mycolicibacterium austroafricanum]PQP41437.1 DoxX family protein [Mycolicibacterium austroafricanum]QRZ04877.1 DoxX family protein [Mycolicibacterium austroafricanum]